MNGKQIAEAFKAIGGKERIDILGLLSSGEKCVCKITKRVKIPQNLVSYHLNALKKAGLIVSRKDGKWVYYSLNEKTMENLGDFLKKLSLPQ